MTNANYTTGTVFTYTYDAVGNRLTQTITNTTVYTYDDASRLTNAGGVAYTWNANGNLLNDGVLTYTYDTVNRLSNVTGAGLTASYAYNGMGARMRQVTGGITTTYALDLNTGLVQVLADSGGNTYLYGNGRIAQFAGSTASYFLADHLGSVRQLTNASGAVTLAKGYQPYGSVLSSNGSGASMYGFTGEVTDNTGLVYLRARYYAPGQGRFLTKDIWEGDFSQPLSFNTWLYSLSNPVNYTDPSGMVPCSLLPPDDQVNCVRTPPGQHWEEIGSDWHISGYIYALEREFSGNLYETGLGAKIKAKWNFLFARDGVVMQGTGILESGRVVHVDNPLQLYWVDKNGNRSGDIDHVGNPEEARFEFGYGGPGYRMLAYYHVAAPAEIPKGTLLYIPAIKPYTPYGGVVKVVDRGGRITGHILDLFVGEGRRPGYDWNYGRNDIRHNVKVYKLTWGSECDQP